MLNKTLLLFTLLFLSGCVERGFELSVNQTTHTVTAIKTVDTRDKKSANTQTDIKKMNTAVEKEQKKIIDNTKTKQTSKTTISKEPIDKKQKIDKNKEAQKEREALLKKQAVEKEKQLALAEKARQELVEKAKEEKLKQEAQAKEIKAMQIQKEKETLEKKLALQKQAQRLKEKEEKLALERKIAQEKMRQAQKAKEEKEALEKKLANQKIAEEKKLALALKAKEAAAEKMRQKQITKEKAAQARKIATEKKISKSNTESLIFKQSKQTYQKFGTSEIHGHVVYMTPDGQDIRLKQTKIYLVPKNTKVDYWYDNYYLKNKEASSVAKTTVNYINATHLNLEKNFAFYGLAEGTYYIIIESSYPSSISKDKKVYIAKKINVEKYKKIMTVFSKKL